MHSVTKTLQGVVQASVADGAYTHINAASIRS
jgi:hypothetical protein